MCRAIGDKHYPNGHRCPSNSAAHRRICRLASRLFGGSTPENRQLVQDHPALFATYAEDRASEAETATGFEAMMILATDRSKMVRAALAANPAAQADEEVVEALEAGIPAEKGAVDPRILAALRGEAIAFKASNGKSSRGIGEAGEKPRFSGKAGAEAAEAFGTELAGMLEKYGPVKSWYQDDEAMEEAVLMLQEHPIAAQTMDEELSATLFPALSDAYAVTVYRRFPQNASIIREAVLSSTPAKMMALEAETTTVRHLLFLTQDESRKVIGASLMQLAQRGLIADPRTNQVQANRDFVKLKKMYY